MKKFLFTVITVLCCMAVNAQNLFELQYYDEDDKETYNGLFFFTDEENCFLRCITAEPDEDGNYPYWERNYSCFYEKEGKKNYLIFVPQRDAQKDEGVALPSFWMEYSERGSFEPVTYVTLQNIEDDDFDESMVYEVEYFREVDIREKKKDYFLQFYDEDEKMFKQIMAARKQLINQDNGGDRPHNKPDNGGGSYDGPVTMHLVIVAATQDESIGESVETDVELVKKNFGGIAKRIGIGYKETVIQGNNFKKSNILNTIRNLNPGKNDVVIFVYSGHGFRYDDDKDAYPRMYLTYDGDLSANTELSTTELYNEIVDKNARLTIFLTDCCNSKVGMTRAQVESVSFGTRAANTNVDNDKLRALFVEESGTVRATAAKAGQYALCDASGGFMLTSILNNIKAQTSALSDNSPSWTSIIENASKAVAKKTANQIDEAGNETSPQIVVRSVKVQGNPASGKASSLSSDTGDSEEYSGDYGQSEESDEGDIVAGLICILIPILVIIILIIIIVKLVSKKKKQQ